MIIIDGGAPTSENLQHHGLRGRVARTRCTVMRVPTP
jgi:hypothetical protein